MKKQLIWKWILSLGIVQMLIALLVGMIMLAGIGAMMYGEDSGSYDEMGVGVQGLPPSVMKWEQDVERLTNEYQIIEYKPYILAIIMVESGGNGGDPMRSSESAGQAPGSITNPLKSLEQGISYFAGLVKSGKEKECDISTILQSYNFGGNYINYVSKNGKKSDVSLAEIYSKIILAPLLGNSSGLTYPYKNAISLQYNKPYLYSNGGNFFYAELVKQYVQLGSQGGEGIGEYKMPVPTPARVTSGYGYRIDPITGSGTKLHRGVDFGGTSSTHIYAAKEGTVVYSQFNNGGFGNCVVIQHDDGMMSLYAHLSQLQVSVGMKVNAGSQLGLMGTTGSSTGIHLHFALMKSMFSNYVDPTSYLGL